MINGYPSEEELRSRISNQINWRGKTENIALIWHGYLAALLEWGLLDAQVFDRLSSLLPPVGNKELYELFTDEPLSSDREREINYFLSQKKK